MTPRRQQTMYPGTQQPVKFYKFIAITFLFITILLLGFIFFMSSKRAVITIETKEEPIDVQGQFTFGPNQQKGQIKGSVTTTLVTASYSVTPTGSKEEPGTAVGMVTLYNNSGVSQPLVATTRLISAENILFRIKDRVIVPANGSVDVEVYADVSGKEGDIGPTTFIIPGLSQTRQKQVYAKNIASMTGGSKKIGAVSAEDISAGEKQLLSLLLQQAQEKMAKEYPDTEAVYQIIQHVVETKAKSGDQVATFAVEGKATVLGVFYKDEEISAWVNSMLMKRALNDAEIIEPGDEKPTLKITDYTLEKGEVDIDGFFRGIATINPESKQLEKLLFFGKTKEEVRRYILSLDHVRGVDVKFTPAWMMSVPHIADHVTVIVKNVE